ncbi:AraC family ligand binding domain-containing protein [Paenibacillus sp. GCM10027626]|uniref:AraC family ligand binding domain-containing protein n=1 Tax=Paenibacillus sp. GCM10027626 TaxID=3273411 RepID=UPI00363967BC
MTKYLDDMISPIPIRMERLTVDPSLLRIKGLSIIEFGHLPKRKLRHKSVSNNHWAFTYIVRGRGIYRAGDGAVQRLEPGSVFWEWPGTSYGYGPDEGTDWDEFYFSFSAVG